MQRVVRSSLGRCCESSIFSPMLHCATSSSPRVYWPKVDKCRRWQYCWKTWGSQRKVCCGGTIGNWCRCMKEVNFEFLNMFLTALRQKSVCCGENSWLKPKSMIRWSGSCPRIRKVVSISSTYVFDLLWRAKIGREYCIQLSKVRQWSTTNLGCMAL
ncbi:MAG: Uncharacterised protein [Cryomorphaceae bacterium]|nr:MAG: Uncharacterised protein [Cryomorphaceae bacterium]